MGAGIINIRQELIQIFVETFHDEAIREVLLRDDLTVLKMNSLSYIRLVVNIEDHFNIEFGHAQLNNELFTSFTALVEYVTIEVSNKVG